MSEKTQINFGLIVGRCFFEKRYEVITPIILGLYWEENLVLIGGLYWTLMVVNSTEFVTGFTVKLQFRPGIETEIWLHKPVLIS